MLKNVKCARCVKCGKEYEAVPNLTNCECGGILDIIYDYDYIKANLTKEKLKSRPNTMWRYRELLPVEETTPDTPLRVGWSPLYEEDRLAKLLGLKTDNLMELTYTDRKRIHNLKYYTWVEQQARDVKDLNALWYDTKGTWDAVHAQAAELDELINEFNEATGLLKAL